MLKVGDGLGDTAEGLVPASDGGVQMGGCQHQAGAYRWDADRLRMRGRKAGRRNRQPSSTASMSEGSGAVNSIASPVIGWGNESR